MVWAASVPTFEGLFVPERDMRSRKQQRCPYLAIRIRIFFSVKGVIRIGLEFCMTLLLLQHIYIRSILALTSLHGLNIPLIRYSTTKGLLKLVGAEKSSSRLQTVQLKVKYGADSSI